MATDLLLDVVEISLFCICYPKILEYRTPVNQGIIDPTGTETRKKISSMSVSENFLKSRSPLLKME